MLHFEVEFALDFLSKHKAYSGLLCVFRPRVRSGGAGFELFSQSQTWLPQGLAAASVPEHLILDVLL